jgi:large subunit ribosomal protein L29
MKISDIRLLGVNELKTKLTDTRQEYMNLRFQMVTGQLTDTSRLKQTRHLISTFETILRERELGIGQDGDNK